MRYVVEKGSITIDGISLTVAKVTDDSLSVSVIPHTRAVTNLAMKGVGDVVNLETDIIGKYVERLLSGGSCLGKCSPADIPAGEARPTGITEEFLAKYGF